MAHLIDLFLNLDAHLRLFFEQYGVWAYALYGFVIFAETGLVVTPFLPGDSLLFAAGALSAGAGLDLGVVLTLTLATATLGNTTNYWVGRLIARQSARTGRQHRLVKPEYLEQTHRFFGRWGGWAVSLCRFVPIVRTITPFVAGFGRMDFGRFTLFNLAGTVAWTLVFVLTGYFFGNFPFVQDNFHYLMLGIVLVSAIPVGLAILKGRAKPAPAQD